MLKKVLIAGLFIGGGIFFIKKILPQLTGSPKKIGVELEDIDAVLAQREKEMRKLAEQTKEQIESKIGDKDAGDINSWIFAPDINYDQLQDDVKKQLAEKFGVDEFWNPNNLSSYKGLEGFTLGLPNVTVPQMN
jgi:hypothetical protein